MTIKLDPFNLKKINLIDEFRGRFSMADNEKLKLPQIIVVGDQSSGKSSILEAISGIKLPRGVDTVTKCPVVIQMRHSKTIKKQIKCKNDEFQEIEETDKEISRVQREMLNDELTEEPITLHIESPNVQTLTIIDLPGIVKTKTSDQSEDIIEMTHNIAKMYMMQENSLIICVLPANQDISTTTTIKLASECNESMSRIIGVLTKLDKIDAKEASLIPDILQNKKLPIEKGFYGLVVGDKFLESDSKHREKFEKECFCKLKIWEEYKSRLGLGNFIKALVDELIVLINDTLPELYSNIKHIIMETETDLTRCTKFHDTPQLQNYHIMTIAKNVLKQVDSVMIMADIEIQTFSPVTTYLTTQRYLDSIGPHTTFLFLWHNIYKSLHDGFRNRFKEMFENTFAPYKDPKTLDDLIKECRVDNVIVFNSAKPFKLIVDKILNLFKNESLACILKCHNIINNIICNVLIIDIEPQFRMIKMDVLHICLDILEKQDLKIRDTIRNLFESEHSYFTQDAFMDVDRLTSYEGHQYKNGKYLKQCLEKYIENLIRRLGDCIPNYIRLILFVNFKDEIESQLFVKLNSPQNMSKYFGLSAEEVENCNKLKRTLHSLKQSKRDLDNLNVTNASVNILNGHF